MTGRRLASLGLVLVAGGGFVPLAFFHLPYEFAVLSIAPAYSAPLVLSALAVLIVLGLKLPCGGLRWMAQGASLFVAGLLAMSVLLVLILRLVF